MSDNSNKARVPKLPWENENEKLRDTYGEPYFVDAKLAITGINESYWAGLYAAENIVLYEPDEVSFYRYNPDSGIYEIESTDALRSKISAWMLEASRKANLAGLQLYRSVRILNNIITHLRGIVERRGVFAKPRDFIHVANGVIVFKDGKPELRPFSPEFYSRNRSPVVYDPNARCEKFLNELLVPAVHPEDVELLQKFAGMFLLVKNRAQRLLILDGEGGRGKTQFANVVLYAVGRPNVTQLRTKHLAERFEIFRFRNKLLLVGVDVEADFLNTPGAAILKALVGGDWHDAEQKGGTGSFQIQGTFNVLITSNARLRVRLQGDLSAWKRRLAIVRYEAPPPAKQIPDFADLLFRIEGSGILNWMIEGARKVLSELPDEGGDITLTPRQKEIVESLLAESDSVRHFLKECVVNSESGELAVSELVEAYSAYCRKRKWQTLPKGKVYSTLESLMLELFGAAKRHDISRDGESQRGFRGVAFRLNPDAPDGTK